MIKIIATGICYGSNLTPTEAVEITDQMLAFYGSTNGVTYWEDGSQITWQDIQNKLKKYRNQ